MLSDPGSKLDFGTLIAYLIPGFILEFFLFCLADSITIFATKTSLPAKATWGATEVAIAGALFTLLAYMLGLLLDLIAHPLTLQNELRMKGIAYQTAVSQFNGFIKNKEIHSILHASENDIADLAKRDLFIDSMFYRLATQEIWARQNWHWAFYEFSRQMHLLCIPTVAATSFYAALVVIFVNSPSLEPFSTFGVSLGVTGAATLVNWFALKPLLKNANDTDCMVYYRHRAWVIFAYLIEMGLLTKSLSDGEEKEVERTNEHKGKQQA